MKEGDVSIVKASPIDPNRPFAFGIGALLLGLLLAVLIPTPTLFQKAIFTVVIGLGGAGFATAISGFLEVSSKWVTAGGSLGVFVFICLFVWNTTNQIPSNDVDFSEKTHEISRSLEGNKIRGLEQ